MTDLNALAAEIHAAAVKKGFWDVEDATKKHLAKMISELGEVVQADRAGVMYEIERDGAKPEGVVAELADFAMMLMDFGVTYGSYWPSENIRTWNDRANDALKWFENASVYSLVLTITATFVLLENAHTNEHTLEILYAIHEWLRIRGYDLFDVIRQKMEYNKSRPALHGRAY